VASASTLIVNANPLLRFDGYYILSDLVEIPNLSQRANQQLRFLWERHVFGVKQAESPTQRRREGTWLVVYGIASGIYRVIVFGGVLLLVADRFLLIGLLMAAICAISWIGVPTGKFLRYLAASPRLARVRLRAVAVTAVLAGVLLVLLAVIPFPHHYRAPGVLKAKERTLVVADVTGRLKALLAKPGSTVVAGQPLIELASRELELSLDDARARLAETEARLRQALSRTNADLKPLQSRLKSTEDRLQKLNTDRQALLVKARHAGVWIAPGVEQFVGRLIEHGTPLGLIVNPNAFEFVAIVDQADADAAFAHKPSGAEVRLKGQSGSVLRADRWRVVPGGNRTLPSAALGWAAGGEVPISKQEPTQAATPFFEVQADVTGVADVPQLHGRSGKIRFDLEPEPLLTRWLRRLWQLLQTRYQL
jgi:putative peptide zinc metalloprotease protein